MNNSPFQPGSSVVIYLRDSGGDEQEMSTEQQERVLREWASVNNVVISLVFSDSVSGTSTKKRNDFLRMMAHFQHGATEKGILVWRSNRFGRNLDDAQYFKSDLRRRGFIIHSVTDNIPDGPMGKFIEFALDWKDEVFSAQLSEDVKRGLSDLVKIYGAVPGTPPRGFMRVPITLGTRRSGTAHTVCRWEPDPEKIPLVQRAFEMRARGATLRQIQEETKLYKNKNGWVTFFGNTLYKGILHFGDLTIENYCKPIVTAELWDAANLVGLQRRHMPAHQSQARRLSSSFLLSGLVYCAQCGALMSGKIITKWRYYACSARLAHFDCKARHIPAPQLETELEQVLLNEILKPLYNAVQSARHADPRTLQ